MNYELEYEKETGDKKPEFDVPLLIRENLKAHNIYLSEIKEWNDQFIKWLSARLEKAEKEKTSQVVHPLNMEECKPNTLVTYCYMCGQHVRNQQYCSGCGRKLIWENIYSETEKIYK